MAEAADLSPAQCQFESDVAYQFDNNTADMLYFSANPLSSMVEHYVYTVRGGGSSPSAGTNALVAQLAEAIGLGPI